MSELIQNSDKRQEALKSIVQDLNSEADVAKVKKRFDKLIRGVSPEEIAAMEQSLIDGGVPVEHVQKLCEVHVSVFETALKKQPSGKALPGHPAATLKEENKELKKILKSFRRELRRVQGGASFDNLRMVFANLMKIEIHYQRKENQLFPYLEEVDFTGPSKVMWGKHDEIRDMLKLIRSSLENEDRIQVAAAGKKVIPAMKRMIFMEEKILLPTALRKLTDLTWAKIRRGEPQIGYAWVVPGNLWDADLIFAAQPVSFETQEASAEAASTNQADRGESGAAEQNDTVNLDVGVMTVHQVNLMLKHLPFDVTYVDEEDKVRYYSQGRERHFPRSPGIIGRSVQNCHPPKSVHVVEQIVDSFRKKEKDSADFWIRMGEKLIYIRYFPVFDDEGVYRGVVEVTQDIAEIQSLEGEKRLLD